MPPSTTSFHPPSKLRGIHEFSNNSNKSSNRKIIAKAIYDCVKKDAVLRDKLNKIVAPREIHEVLFDLIDEKEPAITVIIEKKDQTLKDNLQGSLRYSPINIIEFRTFRKEDTDNKHIYLFESLNKEVPKKEREPPRSADGKRDMSPREKLYLDFFTELIATYRENFDPQLKIAASPHEWAGFGSGKSNLSLTGLIEITNGSQSSSILILEIKVEIRITSMNWKNREQR